MIVSVEVGSIADSRLVSTLIVTAFFTTAGIVAFIAAICVCAKQNVHLDDVYAERTADIEKRVDQQQTLKGDVKITLLATKLKKRKKSRHSWKDVESSATVRTEMELLTDDQTDGRRTVPEAPAVIERQITVASSSACETSAVDKSSLYFWLILLGILIYFPEMQQKKIPYKKLFCLRAESIQGALIDLETLKKYYSRDTFPFMLKYQLHKKFSAEFTNEK
jgi:hypothetical protein